MILNFKQTIKRLEEVEAQYHEGDYKRYAVELAVRRHCLLLLKELVDK